MKRVIGVMGSSRSEGPAFEEKARQLGQAIALAGAVLLTGATGGYPQAAARGASAAGGLVLGLSPAQDLAQHRAQGILTDAHDVILCTGLGSVGRNVLNIRACDAICFTGGSVGSLNEFTAAFIQGKVMGVLTGSGGISDRYGEILAMCEPGPTGAEVLYDGDPEALVRRLLERLQG